MGEDPVISTVPALPLTDSATTSLVLEEGDLRLTLRAKAAGHPTLPAKKKKKRGGRTRCDGCRRRGTGHETADCPNPVPRRRVHTTPSADLNDRDDHLDLDAYYNLG